MSWTVDRDRAQSFADRNLGSGTGKTGAPAARLVAWPRGGSGGGNRFAWANARPGRRLPARSRRPLAARGAARGDAGRRWMPAVHLRGRHRHRCTRPGGARAAGQRASARHLASDCRSRLDTAAVLWPVSTPAWRGRWWPRSAITASTSTTCWRSSRRWPRRRCWAFTGRCAGSASKLDRGSRLLADGRLLPIQTPPPPPRCTSSRLHRRRCGRSSR